MGFLYHVSGRPMVTSRPIGDIDANKIGSLPQCNTITGMRVQGVLQKVLQKQICNCSIHSDLHLSILRFILQIRHIKPGLTPEKNEKNECGINF